MLNNGYVFNSANWEEAGVPIIRIENINGSLSFNYSNSDPGEKCRVRQGDLLFSWSGNPGTSFGPARWNKPGLYYLNQHIFKVSAFGCDKDWLYWSLRAATRWIERELTSGMIGMVHVTKEELSSVAIPLPSIGEQRRIADFLDAEVGRIDRLIGLRTTQIVILRERAEARRSHMVEQLAGAYGWAPLRRIAVSVEQGWSPQCDDVPADPAEWAVLKTSAVSSGVFNPLEHKRLPAGVTPDRNLRVENGDILMTRGSGSPSHVGMAAEVVTEGRNLMMSDLLYRIRLAPQWLPSFAVLLLGSRPVRSSMGLLFRGQSGQTIKLRAEDVRAIEIPAVPVERQPCLAAEMLAIRYVNDEATAAIRASIDRLSERRQALITAAVTGQIDVSTARGVAV